MRKKLVLIQFSRALVPILVLMLHTSTIMQKYFNYDFLGLSFLHQTGGVYYFFALSGFMIYYVHHKEFGQTNKLKKFYINRSTRIYPLYWILTLSVIPIYFLVPSFGEGHETNVDVIITSLLLLPHDHVPIIPAAWSLVYTVFFYLVFSLFYLKGKAPRILFTSWAVITFLFAIGLISIDAFVVEFLFNGYNLIFIAGLLSSYLILHYKINIHVSRILSVIGLVGFPLSWVNLNYQFVQIPFELMIAIASVFLLIGLSSIDLQKEIKIPKLANYIGNSSFSIYITHSLSVSVISKIFAKLNIFSILGGPITGILMMLISIIIGCAVYSFIEQPLNKKLKSVLMQKDKKNMNKSLHVA